ncbi:monooxygenase [Planomonospora sp. ID67723]|nr:monooxygenase [Planomonospora sp. ID67723]
MRRRARWAGTAAAALATVVLVASCGAQGHPATAHDPGTTAGASPKAGATEAHGGHGSAAEPPPAAPLRASERFATLTLPEPYTPKAPSGGTDEYRCFLLDPGLGKRAFLTGSQFLPQNTDLVHHAIIFRVDPDKAEAARKLDAGTPGEGWTCFGDAGIDDGAWVGHWAPGADETLLDEKLGYPMPPGSKLIMQVHYNLLATGGKPGGSDRSAIRLRLTDGKADLKPLETVTLAAPVELPCAPGESGPLCEREAAVRDVAQRFGEQAEAAVTGLGQFCRAGGPPAAGPTQHCDQKAEASGTVHATAGHMHLLGRSIKVELNPGTPGAKTLLDIPDYNFDEQAIRPLAEPAAVKAGDTLRVTCTHDAGLRAMLPALRDLPPRYVVWGEGTSDEMCLGLLVWSARS